MRTVVRGAFLVLLASFGVPHLPGRSASQMALEEYEVKAAYLYNFGRFVRWPEATTGGETFPVCTIGRDPFGATLDGLLAGESIDGRRLVALRLTSLESANACRILFVGRTEESRLATVLGAVSGLPILTVSDLPRFAQRGGMIEFVLDDNRVRFEIDLDAAEASGLRLASELLRVATAVRSAGEQLQ
jgi:hypothetical protein